MLKNKIIYGLIFLGLLTILLNFGWSTESRIIAQGSDGIPHPPQPIPVLSQIDIITDYGSRKNPRGQDIGDVTVTLHGANLCINYQTFTSQNHNWLILKCHVWIDTIQPIRRGPPGQYPYNSGSINTLSYTFEIPLNELLNRFGITWSSMVYMISYCEIYQDLNNNYQHDPGEPTEVGFGYRAPDAWIGGQPWFGYSWFKLGHPKSTEENSIKNNNLNLLPIQVLPSIAKSNNMVFVRYQIPKNENPVLEVYNCAGELIQCIQGTQPNGVFEIDTRNLPSGFYIIKISSEHYQATRKFIIL